MNTPKMTRQDFNYLADLLKCTWPHNGDTEHCQHEREQQHRYVVREMAEWLRATNPRFDRERFLQACGMES